MHQYAEKIRRQLQVQSDPTRQESTRRFFKEEIKTHGVPSVTVKKIVRDVRKTLKDKSKAEIFALCEELWQSGYLEEGGAATELAFTQAKAFQPEDITVFDRWLEQHVSNWAWCDLLCTSSVGYLLEKFPDQIAILKQWAASPNRWKQRAAAVSLVKPASKGYFLKETFEIADALQPSNDDLVQKGYGWMLKAASKAHPQEVFDYLMRYKSSMPRTAFRYALEKMPAELRAKAMKS